MKTARILLATAALVAVGQASASDFSDYARVRSATPEYERVNQPRQECSIEQVQVEPRRVESGRNVGGAIIGGIAGALIGNQVGQGHGREAATAAGAVAGALIGDRVENRDGSTTVYEEPRSREVRRCRQVDNWQSRITGYRVEYEYAGRRYTTIMPNDPGRELRVRVSVEPQQ
ncbi:glycine zipper 2TM domain-containing protein [Parachitinimonas caeni]|uniref:Glycine zipper 2TM domain-containing protein n=1 Tax=Parachitinimonas caeni TaxID=3031301 RepID=A0ABT7DUB3_9NEIS|nr:glycine zipper 2TM domain-containing protein [Parachitinimonas caeni]MDK2123677.1 glycine zipper 2TM domain-containing protein [Parachitinimonas caeni]